MPEAKERQSLEHNINQAKLWPFHQPSYQTDDWILLISNQCYSPLSRWLAEDKEQQFPVAVSITHSLVRHLQRLHLDDIIENLGIAAEKGNIEFTGTAAYHAILPELLEYKGGISEVKRQISLNHAGNEKAFGKVWQPKGFFLPEMAFSPELAPIIKSMGYDWTVADAPLFDAVNSVSIPYEKIPKVNGLAVFLRSNDWSNELTQRMPQRNDFDVANYARRMQANVGNGWFRGKKGFIVLAYDAETLGHHVRQYDANALNEYAKTCRELGIKKVLPSELLEFFGTIDIEIMPGSWSTSVEDIKAGEYFPLWAHSKNPVHNEFKKLTAYAISSVYKAEGVVDGNTQARDLYRHSRVSLDESVQSCIRWWANPLHDKWDENSIYRGFYLLKNTITSAIGAIERSVKPQTPVEVNGFYGTAPELMQNLLRLENEFHNAVAQSRPK